MTLIQVLSRQKPVKVHGWLQHRGSSRACRSRWQSEQFSSHTIRTFWVLLSLTIYHGHAQTSINSKIIAERNESKVENNSWWKFSVLK